MRCYHIPANDLTVRPLKDKVAAALKDGIFSGQLRPGQMIVERQLALQMNLGAPTPCEALVILEQLGFMCRVANTADTYQAINFPQGHLKE